MADDARWHSSDSETSGQALGGQDVLSDPQVLVRLLEALPVGVTAVDRDGSIVYANGHAERVLGLSRDSITRRAYNAPGWRVTAVDGGPFPEERMPFRRVRDTGAPVYDLRHAIEWPDGRRVLLSINGVPILDAEGAFQKALFTIADITEPVRDSEMRLRGEEEKEAILNSVDEHVLLQDMEHRMIWVNRAACASVNMRPEELMSHRCHEIWHGRTEPCVGCPVAKARETGEMHEGVVESPDGRIWHVRGYPVRDQGGDLIGILEVTYDATEQNRVEQELQKHREQLKTLVEERTAALRLANERLQREIFSREHLAADLRQSELRYRTLLETAGDAIFVADVETGVILEANQQAARMLGRPLHEIVGMHQSELHAPEERAQYEQLFRAHASGIGIPTANHQVLHSSGKRIPVEIVASVAEIDGRSVIQGIFHDISERKRMQDRLHQSEKMQAIGQLAGGIAHDFNNRLVAIKGFAEILRGEISDQQHRGYLDRIIQGAGRLADLTSQLLAFARKGEYQATAVNLHDKIGEVVLFLEHSIDKRIRIRQDLAAERPFTTGDPTQIQNVILNLAINARDAMPSGGELMLCTETVTLDARACKEHASRAQPGTYVVIRVSDTGMGMDEETRKHIFEPFFTTKKIGEGTGMGLAAVYGTVENHKGFIEVESVQGQGTTFNVYLPLRRQGRDTDSVAAAPARKGAGHILVVDDEIDTRDFLSLALGKLGYRISTCANGEGAIRFYSEHWQDVDLVILDMMMPDLTGRETFRRLRAVNPDVKVILSTGFSLAEEAMELRREGVADYVRKPFEITALSERIAALLNA